MRGQIGQFDLFVFDDAILFGVCKYVQRNGTIRYISSGSTYIFRIHVSNLMWRDSTIPLHRTYLHTPKRIASSMTKRSN